MSQAGIIITGSITPGTVVETLTGNSGGPVGPDLANNINVVGDGTTIDVAGNPGTNTLTISAIPGSEVVTLTGNSGGAVSPDGLGNINVVGDGTTIDIVGNPGTNTLTVSAIAGSSVITLTGNTGGAVGPSGLGNINLVNDATTVKIKGNPGTNTLTQDYAETHLLIGSNSAVPTPASGLGENVGIGVTSLSALTQGFFNVAVGSFTLDNLTIGGSNTAVGSQCMRFLSDTTTLNVRNTAVGNRALRQLTAGRENTAIGNLALNQANGSNEKNVALGDSAGFNIINGNNNILISNLGVDGENNAIRIGYVAPAPSGKTAHTANYMGGVLGNTVSGSIVNINATTAQLGVTAMTSDSSGRVTNTSQPLFSVYNNNAIVNATGDNTIYTIIFDTTDVNQGSVYNSGTGTFTAPVTGRYLFGLTCTVSNLSSGHTEGKVFVVTTPRTYTGNWVNPFVVSTGGAGIYTFTTSVLVSLTASQTAQFQVQVSNSTKTVNVAGGVFTYAYGYLVA